MTGDLRPGRLSQVLECMLELRCGSLSAGDLRIDDTMQAPRRGWNKEMKRGRARLRSLRTASSSFSVAAVRLATMSTRRVVPVMKLPCCL